MKMCGRVIVECYTIRLSVLPLLNNKYLILIGE